MYFSGRDFWKGLAILAVLSAVAGWALIEALFWVADNISIVWGE